MPGIVRARALSHVLVVARITLLNLTARHTSILCLNCARAIATFGELNCYLINVNVANVGNVVVARLTRFSRAYAYVSLRLDKSRLVYSSARLTTFLSLVTLGGGS